MNCQYLGPLLDCLEVTNIAVETAGNIRYAQAVERPCCSGLPLARVVTKLLVGCRTRLGPNEVDVKDLQSFPNASKKDSAAPAIQKYAEPPKKKQVCGSISPQPSTSPPRLLLIGLRS